MIFALIDQKIRKAFSNSALQYEVLASLQKEIGRELIKKIVECEEAKYILDVGMGTGYLTNKLRNYFPESCVIGMDFAGGMVDCAKKKYENLNIVQADAKWLPFQNGTFDIIISNLAYQWVKDLNLGFRNSYNVIKNNGTICLTLFGENTLNELFTTIEVLNEYSHISKIERLMNISQVEKSLHLAGFKNIKVKNEMIKSHFPNMIELIRWLKNIGANIPRNEIFMGKQSFIKANQYYEKRFSHRLGVYATFEVIWVQANK